MGLVQDSEQFVRNAWNAVDEMGGDIPPNKNLANLPEGIASIPTGPAVPTSLDELKKMINAGKQIAVGSVIPDTYNGISNPLIVVRYLDGTDSAYQNADGTNAKGVILQRSYITDVGQKWDSTNSYNYTTSLINTFLNGDYINRCSSTIQSIVSECKIPVVIHGGATTVQCKWFLPSIEEVYGDANAIYAPGAGKEGSYFPYWKDKTGLSSPSNNANDGRIIKVNSDGGAAGYWWLRSRYTYNTTTTTAWNVYPTGAVGTRYVYSTELGVLPACFIGKDN